ncbi:alpha-1,2-mannosyltransferase Mnn2p [Trichomonascus vanleenenianus]|uniref:alpha-mannosyltransferase n=1 Tax=Trichomonascus vanleenenianus TaxID=2268995 RepID=UPI003ECB4A8D
MTYVMLPGDTMYKTVKTAKPERVAVGGGEEEKGFTDNTPNFFDRPVAHSEEIGTEKVKKDHYEGIFEIFSKAWPNVTLGRYKDDIIAPKAAFDDENFFTNERLGEYLQVSDEEISRLKKGHEIAVKELPSTYPEGIYKRRGLVTLAGGRYMPLLLTNLRMLRKYSPDLPVEIFMADDVEYEKELCEKVIPELNAKCIKLKDIIGDELWKKHDIRSYQLKAFAILMSSFEDVMFLDADDIPLGDVAQFFDKEPFRSTGYVFWPDYWFRTTSPHFYTVVGRQLGPRVRGNLSETDPAKVPQADLEGALADKSTESGQLYVSKAKHYKSLLLATYYNLNGFNAYYKLLTQGSGGEGDKDTFIAAAEILREPYRQVEQDTRPAGYFTPKEGGGSDFHGTGMLQADPYDDYKLHVLKTTTEKPRIQFMHLNYPKPNPRELMSSHKEQYEKDENRVRYYGKPSENTHVFGQQDIELQMWNHLKWSACDLGVERGIVLKDWKQTDIAEMCQKIKDQVAWLEKTSDV